MEMKYILEIFDIFEAYCLCRFILFHCPYKDGKRHFGRTFLWGVAVVLSTASLNILTYGSNVPYGMLLCLLVTVIFSHINLKHSLRYKIIICSMIPVIFMLLDSTVAIIFVMVTKSDNSWNAIFEPGNRIMLAIIAKFVDMVVLEIYYILCKQRTEKNDIGISVVLFAVVGFGVSCIIIHIMMSQSSSSFLFITIMYHEKELWNCKDDYNGFVIDLDNTVSCGCGVF